MKAAGNYYRSHSTPNGIQQQVVFCTKNQTRIDVIKDQFQGILLSGGTALSPDGIHKKTWAASAFFETLKPHRIEEKILPFIWGSNLDILQDGSIIIGGEVKPKPTRQFLFRKIDEGEYKVHSTNKDGGDPAHYGMLLHDAGDIEFVPHPDVTGGIHLEFWVALGKFTALLLQQTHNNR